MNTELKFVSLADSVFEQMENNILSGVYPKGAFYTEAILSEHFGVSRTPIREAIRRLEQEGLIHVTKKGVEIKGLDRADLADIYEIRIRLESDCAARCAERITEAELSELKEILDLQEYYTQKALGDKIRDTDSRFHERIYASCGSPIYQYVLSDLHRRIQRFRKMSVQNTARAEKAAEEHRRIYSALAAHDAERARNLTEEHLTNARKSTLAAYGDGAPAEKGAENEKRKTE